jgi:hypothetical protein
MLAALARGVVLRRGGRHVGVVAALGEPSRGAGAKGWRAYVLVAVKR